MNTTTHNLARLRRIRLAVRLTLILGVAASVAANVLHADPNPISQAIAAWAPLALLLSVELISRVPVHHPAMALLRLLATAAIAGIAAWVSYWHMVAVATRYGETGITPYLLPISVDGLIVVASISLVELAGRIRHTETPLTPVDTHTSTTGTTGPTARAVDTIPANVSGTPSPALLGQARLVANAHHRATATTITPGDLARRIRTSEHTAAQLLAQLDTGTTPDAPTGSTPAPAPINGTPTTVGSTAVQEALL
jgi:hypothetical protein